MRGGGDLAGSVARAMRGGTSVQGGMTPFRSTASRTCSAELRSSSHGKEEAPSVSGLTETASAIMLSLFSCEQAPKWSSSGMMLIDGASNLCQEALLLI